MTITFTNKAASELKERLAHRLGLDVADTLHIGTFHAICSRLFLRPYVHLLGCGLNADYSCIDTDESRDVFSKVIQDEPELQRLPSRDVSKLANWLKAVLDDLKGQLETSHRADVAPFWAVLKAKHPLPSFDSGVDCRMTLDLLQRLIDGYHQTMYDTNTVDFNCILSLTVYLLTHFPQVRADAQDRYTHILVDEFQDTNAPQFAIVRLLKGDTGSLFVVGDPDQAIYGWRGANSANMERLFEEFFPGGQLVYMNNNYRSVPEVLQVAEAVLSHNGTPALHQPLVAARGGTAGHTEHVSGLADQWHEAEWVAGRIKALHDEEGLALSDMAVLYRRATMSRPIVEALRELGMGSRVVGEQSFYQRPEVKDVMSYLTWVLNPDSVTALERIYAKPARGLGNKTVKKLQQAAAANGTHWAHLVFGDLHMTWLAPEHVAAILKGEPLNSVNGWNRLHPSMVPGVDMVLAASCPELHLTSKATAALDELRSLLVVLRSVARHATMKDVVVQLLKQTDYMKLLTGVQSKDALAALTCLGAIAGRFSEQWAESQPAMAEAAGDAGLRGALRRRSSRSRSRSPCLGARTLLPALAGFIDQLFFNRDTEAFMAKGGSKGMRQPCDAVQLMTLHASKGLEYRAVFIIGCEDGLLPNIVRDNCSDGGEHEEEKRLAFVGCTRAKEQLYLTTCRTRSLYSQHGQEVRESPYITAVRRSDAEDIVKWTQAPPRTRQRT